MAVVVEFTPEDEKVNRAFAKLEGKVATLEGKLKGAGRAGKQAGEKTSKAFDASKITKYAGALTGAGGLLMGLRLITAEYDNIITRQGKMAAAQMDLSAHRKDLILTLTGKSPAEIQRVLKGAGQIAAQTGLPEKYV
ncbi:unnamed protein product, partial [marine sediment metagenome]